MKSESELTQEQLQQMNTPVCPYCGQDPALISARQFNIGNLKTALLFCGNLDCRKIFSLSVIEAEKPRVVGADGTLLFRPS